MSRSTTAQIQVRALARRRESVDRMGPVSVRDRLERARSRSGGLSPGRLAVRRRPPPPRSGRGGHIGAGAHRRRGRSARPGDTRTPARPPHAKRPPAPPGRLPHKPDAEPHGRRPRSSPLPLPPRSVRSARASTRCPSHAHRRTAAPQRYPNHLAVCPWTTLSPPAEHGRSEGHTRSVLSSIRSRRMAYSPVGDATDRDRRRRGATRLTTGHPRRATRQSTSRPSPSTRSRDMHHSRRAPSCGRHEGPGPPSPPTGGRRASPHRARPGRCTADHIAGAAGTRAISLTTPDTPEGRQDQIRSRRRHKGDVPHRTARPRRTARQTTSRVPPTRGRRASHRAPPGGRRGRPRRHVTDARRRASAHGVPPADDAADRVATVARKATSSLSIRPPNGRP
jgi:hypothetical protein